MTHDDENDGDGVTVMIVNLMSWMNSLEKVGCRVCCSNRVRHEEKQLRGRYLPPRVEWVPSSFQISCLPLF
jgi:hypothetical protein